MGCCWRVAPVALVPRPTDKADLGIQSPRCYFVLGVDEMRNLSLIAVVAAALAGCGETSGDSPRGETADVTCRDWCANEFDGPSCHQGSFDTVQLCYQECLSDYEEQVARSCSVEWIAFKDCQLELDCNDLFGDCDIAEQEHANCVATEEAQCEAESTFAQVQQQVFEETGCTASPCHGQVGSSAQGGLDLRPSSAYSSLIYVPAQSGDYMRVFPGDEDLSLLYLKIAAKTDGFELSSLNEPISGEPMPIGDMVGERDLALLRVWIRAGAPETGIVEGSQQYANCVLAGDVP